MSGMCFCRLPLLACKDPTAFGAAKGLAGRGKFFFRLILLMGRVSSRIDRNKIKRWQQTPRKYQKIRSQIEHIEPPWSPSPPFVRKGPLMREPVPAARHLGSAGRFKKMGPALALRIPRPSVSLLELEAELEALYRYTMAPHVWTGQKLGLRSA